MNNSDNQNQPAENLNKNFSTQKVQVKKAPTRSAIHGLILVDKPVGITSHDVVSHLRKIFSTKEVGHCGTLDPLASGLIVGLLGEATKLSNYLLEGNKSYELTLEFGKSSDTLDNTGNVQLTGKALPSLAEARNLAEKLVGTFTWPTPIYSAAKVAGKKLYEYAREEKEVVIPMKEMSFWGLEILAQTENTLSARISCSKGSFIRSWCDQMGQLSGAGAVMTALRRIKSEPFSIDQAMTLDQLRALNGDFSAAPVIPASEALPHVPTLKINGNDLKLLRNGQISHDLRQRLIVGCNPEVDRLWKILSDNGGSLVALIGLEPLKGFQIRRIFNEFPLLS